MNESVLHLFVLLRFLCFVAVFYLALHVLLSRLIANRDSKVLWFFSIVTSPLTRPVRKRLGAGAPESRVLLLSLGFYSVLWLLVAVAAEAIARALL
jgi:hypothetical protein